jgi:hypothetical protein
MLINFVRTIIQFVVTVIIGGISIMISIIVTIIFVAIPTQLLQVEDQIPYIENDICLDLPEEYEVAEKNEDWLGFDASQVIVLKFSKKDFAELKSQVAESKCLNEDCCSNGKWIKQSGYYEYELKNDFVEESEYFFDAKLMLDKRTIEYKYFAL